MKRIKYIGAFALTSLIMLVSACEKNKGDDDNTPQKGEFTLEFEHLFAGNTFSLNESYTNGSGESIEFTKVRYYISNIVLTRTNGTQWAEEESYYLVDISDAASTHINIKDVPAGEYEKISYMIGVDSLRNVSGAQEGALSPANDMFWSWSSGYIFIKLEGNSPQASDSTFMYHVGGFTGINKAQTVKAHHLHDHLLRIAPNAAPQAHVKVDLKKVFDGSHTIQVAQMNKIHMPGAMAATVAHNFQEAFALDHIHD